MWHPNRYRSSRNAMPWEVTRRLPTQEWMSTVVGTKARGYTVTRKIVPAAGPKQARACGRTNDFALCCEYGIMLYPGIYSKAEPHCALLVIMQPPTSYCLLPSAKALLLVFAMLFVTLLGFFMTLQRCGRNEHLCVILASLWLLVWKCPKMIPTV